MKLSIITINYNNLEGLKNTYESVVCQTWTDYEWIVIDGGSTDGSCEFIEEHQDKFAYWCSEPDKGVYNAMNKGIAKAKGEYLNFMNSGDSFYESDTLMKVFSKVHEADIVYGDILRIYDDRECFYKFGSVVDIYTLYYYNIPHQAMFIRLAWHKNHLYDENYKLLADWKNWIAASLENARFEYVPIVVARYPMDGITANVDDCEEDTLRIREQVIPNAIKLSIREIDEYRQCRSAQRAMVLHKKGGFASLLGKISMKILGMLFISNKDFPPYIKEILYKPTKNDYN